MAESTYAYSVGYKKPPKETQFKKGQSGNPRGRPTHRPTIQTVLSEELGHQLNFNENGRQARNSKLRLMVKQAVNKAVAGDFRPLFHLGKLQSWLEAVENKRNSPGIVEDEKTAAERYQELLRSDLQARGLDRWIKV